MIRVVGWRSQMQWMEKLRDGWGRERAGYVTGYAPVIESDEHPHRMDETVLLRKTGEDQRWQAICRRCGRVIWRSTLGSTTRAVCYRLAVAARHECKTNENAGPAGAERPVNEGDCEGSRK